MRPCAAVLALLLACSTSSCGGEPPEEPAGWFTRAVPKETTIAGVRVLLEVSDLQLAPQDVEDALAKGRRANPRAKVECLVVTRTHPLELPMIFVRYAPHETSDRVRWVHSLVLAVGSSDQPTEPWRPRGEDLALSAQVCGPGQSFLEQGQIPEEQLVDMYVGSGVPRESLLPILRAARGHVPTGEVPSALSGKGDEYELTTVRSQDIRGLSGSNLRVTRAGSGWSVTYAGMWVS